MNEVKGTSITLTKGDSFYSVITLKRGDTTYTPQEGDIITFGLKKTEFDTTALITKVIPNDTLLLYLAPADTKQLQTGVYVYDLELKYANGDIDTFINKAKFTLVAEVV